MGLAPQSDQRAVSPGVTPPRETRERDVEQHFTAPPVGHNSSDSLDHADADQLERSRHPTEPAERALLSTLRHLERVGGKTHLASPPSSYAVTWAKVLRVLAGVRAMKTVERGAQLFRRVADYAEATGISHQTQLQITCLLWLESDELQRVSAASRRTYAVTLAGVIARYLPECPLHLLRQYAESQLRRSSGPLRQARELSEADEDAMLDGLNSEHAAMLALMIAAGLRFHEVLRVVDVRFPEPGVCAIELVGPTKTHQHGGRRCLRCRVSERGQRVLTNWLATRRPDQRLFETAYDTLLRTLKTRGATTHSAKRTHHRRLVRALMGHSLQDIMTHTGHKSVAALCTYLGPELEAEARLAHLDRLRETAT